MRCCSPNSFDPLFNIGNADVSWKTRNNSEKSRKGEGRETSEEGVRAKKTCSCRPSRVVERAVGERDGRMKRKFKFPRLGD